LSWAKLPKVELHRHLDASIRFETIIDLAHRNNIALKSERREDLVISQPMKSLEIVLNAFWSQQKVLANYEAIKRVAFENVEDAYLEGIKLIELRFAPLFIQKGKKLGFDEIIEAVIDGITQGMEKFPVQVGLLHIMPRSLELNSNLQATQDILRYRKSTHKNADRIVGIDLADLETDESFRDYAPSIALARADGLGVTIHSGEDSSAEHVRRTLETFQATRIGHGVQIVNDPAVMKLVKDRDVVLEVCPTSNWLTNIVKKIEDHPLRALYDQGVKVTLNSDDPHIMNINLIHEYEVVAQKLGFTGPEFMQMNKWALEKSFLPDDIKKDLRKKISEFR
jgi:adenosine deaminase